jgi:hypothetical protein
MGVRPGIWQWFDLRATDGVGPHILRFSRITNHESLITEVLAKRLKLTRYTNGTMNSDI